MILSAQDIIDQALSLIGVLGTGTILTSEEYKTCLRTMNLMIDRWNLTDLLVYSTNPHIFPFVQGQQTYTLGDLGDFNMPRPSRIERISIQYNTVGGNPIELAIDSDFDLEGWQSIIMKNVPSTFPLYCYNNTGYPFMTLNFWPIPQGPSDVILYTWDLMPFIVNLTDLVELPTGYTDTVIYNLAIRLAQLFDRVPSAMLVAEAKQGIHDINNMNAGTPKLHYDTMWSNGRGGNVATQSIGRVVF